ncbi:MAG TPA: ComF family protein [Casimicrobiaceae bacterium]|nr:ComF family protein [Casimicrobiaceae bacterium]
MSFLAALLRSGLPQHCALCAAASGGALVCDDCASDLPAIGCSCPICALPARDHAICGGCVRAPPPFAETIAALVYAFPVDRLIQRIKYRGDIALVNWAGAALAAAVRARLAVRDPARRPRRIVALPLSVSRQRERGFNQATEIAARVASATAIPLFAPLERVRAGPPQAALPWEARVGNVRGAFAVRRDVRDAHVALVDDVMTTGATLAEASRALLAAGARRVECWVVARTPSPDGA